MTARRVRKVPRTLADAATSLRVADHNLTLARERLAAAQARLEAMYWERQRALQALAQVKGNKQ